MKTRHYTHRAFTLVEMLIVVAIIAIIAGFAFPAITAAMKRARMMDATANARSIGAGLHAYAQDHEGAFPSGDGTANEALAVLLPAYLDSEKVFTVKGSPIAAKCDEKMEPASQALRPGENHWAYISGLGQNARSRWPILVDHPGASRSYPGDTTTRGGTWGGTHAIVLRCDNSAEAVALTRSGTANILPRYDEPNQNALDVESYMGEGARLLLPAGGN